MSKKKASTKQTQNSSKISPVDDPEKIQNYIYVFGILGSYLQGLLVQPETIGKAIMSATCEEYRELKSLICLSLDLLEELDDLSIEDHFKNAER